MSNFLRAQITDTVNREILNWLDKEVNEENLKGHIDQYLSEVFRKVVHEVTGISSSGYISNSTPFNQKVKELVEERIRIFINSEEIQKDLDSILGGMKAGFQKQIREHAKDVMRQVMYSVVREEVSNQITLSAKTYVEHAINNIDKAYEKTKKLGGS